MTTLAAVRTALAAAAGTNTGLTFQLHPPDTFDAPGGYVTRAPFDPRVVFGGGKYVVVFRVWVCAIGVDPAAAGERLDGFVDPSSSTSVVAAVQNGANWTSNLVDYAQVVEIGEFTEIRQNADSRYFAIPIDVEVCW